MTDPRAGVRELFEALRPELHRYCARLTGSVIDGEDLVQDTLLEALQSAPLDDRARLRAWAFRTAHNRAIDRWRSYDRRMRGTLDDERDTAIGSAEPPLGADEVLAREQAVRAALSRFLELPPLQRSCVILKDVLEQSLDDIAELLATSVAAVQAALHRGRRALRERAGASDEAPPASQALVRYATLFGARDWPAVRALLAEDVQLDVVGRFTKRGRGEVGGYFGNYDQMASWSVELAVLDGRAVLAVSRNGALAHVIAVTMAGERVTAIRDYFHVPYVLRDATFAFRA